MHLRATLFLIVLKDQINRAASYQYTIKGTWAEPVVERVAPPTPPAGE